MNEVKQPQKPEISVSAVDVPKNYRKHQCGICLGSHGFDDEEKCEFCGMWFCSYCYQICPMCN